MNIPNGVTSAGGNFPDKGKPLLLKSIIDNRKNSFCSPAKEDYFKKPKHQDILANQYKAYKQTHLAKEKSPKFVETSKHDNFYSSLERIGSMPIIHARSTNPVKLENETARTTHDQSDELPRSTHNQEDELARTNHAQSVELA